MEGLVSAQSRLGVDRTRGLCVCVCVPWASAHACVSALGTWVCCDVRADHMCVRVHARWAAGTLQTCVWTCGFHRGTSSHSSAPTLLSPGRGPSGLRAGWG